MLGVEGLGDGNRLYYLIKDKVDLNESIESRVNDVQKRKYMIKEAFRTNYEK